ncbi:MAG: hypothetical protein ACRD1N_00375 [Terriglobia bacterium]
MADMLRELFENYTGGQSAGSSGAASQTRTQPAAMLQTIQELAQGLSALRNTGADTYSQLGKAVEGWGNIATRTIRQVLQLTDLQNSGEEKSVASHARAEQAKSLASLSALKSTATYRAIAAAAAGFQALGEFDFWAAAQDFTSAALFGTIAGAQFAAISSGGGGAGRSRASYAASGRSDDAVVAAPVSALAAGAAGARDRPSGNLTIAIMGDNEAGEWLANTLNTAVEQRGVQLTASRTSRPAYAQG